MLTWRGTGSVLWTAAAGRGQGPLSCSYGPTFPTEGQCFKALAKCVLYSLAFQSSLPANSLCGSIMKNASVCYVPGATMTRNQFRLTSGMRIRRQSDSAGDGTSAKTVSLRGGDWLRS